MSTDAVALWPKLSRLQERTRRLEKEALRVGVEQATHTLDRPVATYIVDGEKFVITENDVAAVRARLVRPHADESLYELALADKIAERDKYLPKQELRRRLRENIEAIRAEAIAKDIAIDDPMEAVVGD